MTLEKTILEGLSYLFSFLKMKLHLGLGQKDYDRWLSQSAGLVTNKSFRMHETIQTELSD